MTHIQVQMSLKYTPVTQTDLFNVCGNHTTFKLWWKKIRKKKKKIAVYCSDTPVTLKKVKVIKSSVNW